MRVPDRIQTLLRVALVALTAAIFAWPADFRYEYHPIQPLSIFRGPRLFAGLYYAWLLCLFLLLFARAPSRRSHWEKLALVWLFALVFYGYWVITSFGDYPRQDGPYQAATVKYIADTGFIRFSISPSNLYTDYPALHLTTHALFVVTGLRLLSAISLMVLLNLLLYSLVFYWLSLTLTASSTVAGFAGILMIEGNLQASGLPVFHPSNMGTTLMAITLAVLSSARLRHRLNVCSQTVTSLLLAVLAMTHLVSAIALFLILLAMYYLVNEGRGRNRRLVSFASLSFALAMPLMWSVHLAIRFFERVILAIRSGVKERFLSGLPVVFESKLTSWGQVPLWVSSLHLFWLAAMLTPFLLLPPYLAAWRRRNPSEKIAVGGLLGTGPLGVMLLIGGESGIDLARLLVYAPFFAVPLGLLFLLGQAAPRRGFLLGSLVLLVFALSFPTFIANNRNEAIHRFYPADMEVSRFLGSRSASGGTVVVYAPHDSAVVYDLYGALLITEGDEKYLEDAHGFWIALSKMVSLFDASSADTKFLYSRRFVGRARTQFGVRAEDPRWKELVSRLGGAIRSYDSGSAIIYVR